jgi:hypothetical protein
MKQRPHLCLPPVTHTSNAFGLTSKMMCVGIGALSRISWCRQVVDSEKCRSLTVTLHFFLAKARDRCRPIPDPPPVTSAVLPDHSMPSTSQSDSWTVLNALKCCMRITTQLHKLCKPLQESSICSYLGVPASVFAAGWVTGCLVGFILLYIQRVCTPNWRVWNLPAPLAGRHSFCTSVCFQTYSSLLDQLHDLLAGFFAAQQLQYRTKERKENLLDLRELQPPYLVVSGSS